MTDYFCRVRMTWFQIQSACELISTKTERMLVYQHEPENNDENVHVHMYLVGTQVSTDTLKNYIKRFTRIPESGNKFWSFKTEYTPYGSKEVLPIDNGCITYMSKGVLDPVYNKGFDEEEIKYCKSKYDPTIIESVQKKSYQSKLMYVVKETHKESKLRQNQMVDEIIKRLRLDDDITDRAILLMIRQVVIIEQNTICGRYKIRDYFDTVRAKLVSKESWLGEMMGFCVRM